MRLFVLISLFVVSTKSADFYRCSQNNSFVFQHDLVEHDFVFNSSVTNFYPSIELDDELSELIEENDLNNLVDSWIILGKEKLRILLAYELDKHNIIVDSSLYNLSFVPALLNDHLNSDCNQSSDVKICQTIRNTVLELCEKESNNKLEQVRAILEGRRAPELEGTSLQLYSNDLYRDIAVQIVSKEPVKVESGYFLFHYSVFSTNHTFKQCFYGGPLAGLFGNFVSEKLCDGQVCYSTSHCHTVSFGYTVCNK